MSVRQQSKHELAAALQGRYLKATKAAKGGLLDECCAVTGYHRRHAVRLLRHGQFGDPRLAAVQGVPVAPAASGRGRTRPSSSARCGRWPRRRTGGVGSG